MGFGRNQKIAIFGYLLPFAATYFLIFRGYITGPQWVSYIQVYVPIAMGTVLGIAGAIKAAKVIKPPAP